MTARPPLRSRHAAGTRTQLPETGIVVVTGTDEDGDAIARPLQWTGPGPMPVIFMAPERQGAPALAPGQTVLARLNAAGPGRYEGRTIRPLPETPARIVGVFRSGPRESRIIPTDRRARAEWSVPSGQDGGAQSNEIVVAEPLPRRGLGLNPARVIERIGPLGDTRSISLIAIAANDIPHAFAPGALAEAAAAAPPRLGRRHDLRALPLVTIDGADARDFDDAVYAEPDDEGFRLIVAIADVAHYVNPGSALDEAARERGNSVYFPDRVVPMLPEALSTGWCSLLPGEDRACMFVELRIGPDGRKIGHRFGRGLMRSAVRLTYEQVQRVHDREESLGVPPTLLRTLYAAFAALLAARQARGALDLELPERSVMLDPDGKVAAVVPRPRLDSHRLIEEFMIAANVAAAEELESRHAPCLYRVHAAPSAEKLDDLRGFLHGFGISLPAGNQVHPRDLDHVLRRVANTPEAPLVNEVILRSQSQAAYSADNLGHFGLALPRYAHFTSPIRRYADLLVHRSLIRALRLGADGLPADGKGLAETAEHVTRTERRAQAAERDATDRYLTAFMASRVGDVFPARVSGVTRFGLFVTLAENGANGIVPRSALPDDLWTYDQREQTLTGRRTRLTFRLAQPVEVRLAEANPVTGGLAFQLMQGIPPTVATARGAGRGKRSRQR